VRQAVLMEGCQWKPKAAFQSEDFSGSAAEKFQISAEFSTGYFFSTPASF